MPEKKKYYGQHKTSYDDYKTSYGGAVPNVANDDSWRRGVSTNDEYANEAIEDMYDQGVNLDWLDDAKDNKEELELFRQGLGLRMYERPKYEDYKDDTDIFGKSAQQKYDEASAQYESDYKEYLENLPKLGNDERMYGVESLTDEQMQDYTNRVADYTEENVAEKAMNAVGGVIGYAWDKAMNIFSGKSDAELMAENIASTAEKGTRRSRYFENVKKSIIQAYRDNGINLDENHKDLNAMTIKAIDEIISNTNDAYNDAMVKKAEFDEEFGGIEWVANYNPTEEESRRATLKQAGKYFFGQIEKIYDQAWVQEGVGGFWSGLWSGVSDTNEIAFGIPQAQAVDTMTELFKKWLADPEEGLTAEEKMTLDAYFEYAKAMSLRAGTASIGSEAGQSAGMSLQFMGTMAVSGGISGAVTKTAGKLVSKVVAKSMAKALGCNEKFVEKVVSRYLAKGTNWDDIRRKSAGAGGKVSYATGKLIDSGELVEKTGRLIWGGAVQTAVSPSTLTHAYEASREHITIGLDGKPTLEAADKETLLKAWWSQVAFGDDFWETASERGGGEIISKALRLVFGTSTQARKLASLTGYASNMRNVATSAGVRGWKELKNFVKIPKVLSDKMGMHDVPDEMLEEVFGTLGKYISSEHTEDDWKTLCDFFTPESWEVLALSFSTIPMIGAASSTLKYAKAKANFNDAYNTASQQLNQILGDNNGKFILDEVLGQSTDKIGESISNAVKNFDNLSYKDRAIVGSLLMQTAMAKTYKDGFNMDEDELDVKQRYAQGNYRQKFDEPLNNDYRETINNGLANILNTMGAANEPGNTDLLVNYAMSKGLDLEEFVKTEIDPETMRDIEKFAIEQRMRGELEQMPIVQGTRMSVQVEKDGRQGQIVALSDDGGAYVLWDGEEQPTIEPLDRSLKEVLRIDDVDEYIKQQVAEQQGVYDNDEQYRKGDILKVGKTYKAKENANGETEVEEAEGGVKILDNYSNGVFTFTDGTSITDEHIAQDPSLMSALWTIGQDNIIGADGTQYSIESREIHNTEGSFGTANHGDGYVVNVTDPQGNTTKRVMSCDELFKVVATSPNEQGRVGEGKWADALNNIVSAEERNRAFNQSQKDGEQTQQEGSEEVQRASKPQANEVIMTEVGGEPKMLTYSRTDGDSYVYKDSDGNEVAFDAVADRDTIVAGRNAYQAQREYEQTPEGQVEKEAKNAIVNSSVVNSEETPSAENMPAIANVNLRIEKAQKRLEKLEKELNAPYDYSDASAVKKREAKLKEYETLKAQIPFLEQVKDKIWEMNGWDAQEVRNSIDEKAKAEESKKAEEKQQAEDKKAEEQRVADEKKAEEEKAKTDPETIAENAVASTKGDIAKAKKRAEGTKSAREKELSALQEKLAKAEEKVDLTDSKTTEEVEKIEKAIEDKQKEIDTWDKVVKNLDSKMPKEETKAEEDDKPEPPTPKPTKPTTDETKVAESTPNMEEDGQYTLFKKNGKKSKVKTTSNKASNNTTTDKKESTESKPKNDSSALLQRAVDFAKKLHAEVVVVNDASELPETEKDAINAINNGSEVRAWVHGGKVYIYKPYFDENKTSEAEMDALIFHEIIAHQGIPAMMTEVQAKAFYHMVWNSMTKEEKAKMLEYVAETRDSSAYVQALSTPFSKRTAEQKAEIESFQRHAADEFVAHMAEQVSDKENEVKSSIQKRWNAVVKYLQNLLAKLYGERVFVSDVQIQRAILASKKNLENKAQEQKQQNIDNAEATQIQEGLQEEIKAIEDDTTNFSLRMVSTFSGVGTLELGLGNSVESIDAIEYDPMITKAYELAHGRKATTARVQDVDLTKHKNIQYYHASPVCKSYSDANPKKREKPLDIESAEAVASHINQLTPKCVTIENVSSYKNSEALKIIKAALEKNGYTFDEGIYNAKDYGGAIGRRRYILRAVKDGVLPNVEKKPHVSWMERIGDMIDSFPDATVEDVPSIMKTLADKKIDYKNLKEPIMISGFTNHGKYEIRKGNEVGVHLATGNHKVRVIMPDGRIKALTTRAKARLMGISDDVKLSGNNTLDCKVIGNGIPTELTQAVIKPMVEANDSAVSRLADKGVEVDTNVGDARFSVRFTPSVGSKEYAQAVKDLMKVTGRSESVVKKWLKSEQSLANYIMGADADTRALVDMKADPDINAIWDNSDYEQGTVEFSNICRKRLPYTMVFQRLQQMYPDRLFDKKDLETIRGVMKESGMQVACGLCFVEDRRQHNGEIAQQFIDNIKNLTTSNANQIKAIEKLRESQDKYIPNTYDLTTLDGNRELKQNHRDVYDAFIAFNNARGQQSGRLFQAYAEYKREILDWKQSTVDKVNALGGLRIFSFYDFEAHHLIDIVQVITDCASKGVKIQAYTKVPEFAKAMAKTGMKINRSLIPLGDTGLDGNGNLAYDPVEGVNFNDPNFFDASNNDNVGNVLVGINDEQIRKAMTDPFVSYIIPFHTGIDKEVLKQKGIDKWKNYKYSQLEKVEVTDENGNKKLVNADKHGINIYKEVLSDSNIKTEKEFVEKFLGVCKEKGWIPRFEQFLDKDKDGNYKYTKGYAKLLVDFKLFDKNGKILPQEPVKSVFDDEFNKTIIDDYVKDAKQDKNYDDIVNKCIEELGIDHTRFSHRKTSAERRLAKWEKLLDMSNALEDFTNKANEFVASTDPSTLGLNTLKHIREMINWDIEGERDVKAMGKQGEEIRKEKAKALHELAKALIGAIPDYRKHQFLDVSTDLTSSLKVCADAMVNPTAANLQKAATRLYENMQDIIYKNYLEILRKETKPVKDVSDKRRIIQETALKYAPKSINSKANDTSIASIDSLTDKIRERQSAIKNMLDNNELSYTDPVTNKEVSYEPTNGLSAEDKARQEYEELEAQYMGLRYARMMHEMADMRKEAKEIKANARNVKGHSKAAVAEREMYHNDARQKMDDVVAYMANIRDQWNRMVAKGKEDKDDQGLIAGAIDNVKKEVLDAAYKDMNGVERKYGGKEKKPWQRALHDLKGAPMRSLNYILDRFAPRSLSDQSNLHYVLNKLYARARHQELKRSEELRDKVCKKAAEIFGKESMTMRGLSKRDSEETKAEVYNDAYGCKHPLTVGQLAMIYAWAKQSDALPKLERNHIYASQEALDSAEDTNGVLLDDLMSYLPDEWKEFMDWTQEELLPEYRDQYNIVYRQKFGHDMPQNENYFPFRIARDEYRHNTNPLEQNVLAGTAEFSQDASALHDRISNGNAFDILNNSAMLVLADHFVEMEKVYNWHEMNEALKALCTSKTLSQKMNGIDPYLYDDLVLACKNVLGLGVNPEQHNQPLMTYVSRLMQAVAKTKIAFRHWTAMKQLQSIVVYCEEFFANPKFAKEFLKTMSNPVSAIVACHWAYKNIPMLKSRWDEKYAGNPSFDPSMFGEAKTFDVPRWYKNFGMIANSAMDMLACSVGAASMYRAKIKEFKERGWVTDEQIKNAEIPDELREMAVRAAEMFYNKSQQSQERMWTSAWQRSSNPLLVSSNMFMNSPIAFSRMQFKGVKDMFRVMATGGQSAQIAAEDIVKREFDEANKPMGTEDFDNAVKRRKRYLIARSFSQPIAATLAQVTWSYLGVAATLGASKIVGNAVTSAMLGGGDDDDKSTIKLKANQLQEKHAKERITSMADKSKLDAIGALAFSGIPFGNYFKGLLVDVMGGVNPVEATANLFEETFSNTMVVKEVKDFGESMVKAIQESNGSMLLYTIADLALTASGVIDLDVATDMITALTMLSDERRDMTTEDKWYAVAKFNSMPKSVKDEILYHKRDHEETTEYVKRILEEEYINLKAGTRARYRPISKDITKKLTEFDPYIGAVNKTVDLKNNRRVEATSDEETIDYHYFKDEKVLRQTEAEGMGLVPQEDKSGILKIKTWLKTPETVDWDWSWEGRESSLATTRKKQRAKTSNNGTNTPTPYKGNVLNPRRK